MYLDRETDDIDGRLPRCVVTGGGAQMTFARLAECVGRWNNGLFLPTACGVIVSDAPALERHVLRNRPSRDEPH